MGTKSGFTKRLFTTAYWLVLVLSVVVCAAVHLTLSLIFGILIAIIGVAYTCVIPLVLVVGFLVWLAFGKNIVRPYFNTPKKFFSYTLVDVCGIFYVLTAAFIFFLWEFMDDYMDTHTFNKI